MTVLLGKSGSGRVVTLRLTEHIRLPIHRCARILYRFHDTASYLSKIAIFLTSRSFGARVGITALIFRVRKLECVGYHAALVA